MSERQRDSVSVTVDDIAIDVPPGTTVAAVLANAGFHGRRSVSGEQRAALCGMGVCHECRVTIDGRAHQRACMTTVVAGMAISLDA